MNVGDPFNPYRMFQGAFLPNWLLERQEVSHGAKIIYARLYQHCGRDGLINPSLEVLSVEVGMSVDQSSRYIKELRDIGLLGVERRGLGRTNVYTFTWHEWIENANQDSADVRNQESAQTTFIESAEVRSPIKVSEKNQLKESIEKRGNALRASPPPDHFQEFHDTISELLPSWNPTQNTWQRLEDIRDKPLQHGGFVQEARAMVDWLTDPQRNKKKTLGSTAFAVNWLYKSVEIVKERKDGGSAQNWSDRRRRDAGSYLQPITESELERRGNRF